MPGTSKTEGRPLFWAFAATVFLSLLAGRFLFFGKWGFAAFFLVVPVLLFVLAWRVGLGAAVVLVIGFSVGTLVVRGLVLSEAVPWPAVFILPALILASVISAKVVAALRWGPSALGIATGGAPGSDATGNGDGSRPAGDAQGGKAGPSNGEEREEE